MTMMAWPNRAPYFYVLAILCSSATDLLDRTQLEAVEMVDKHVRASTEACVIHAWMIDLWDVSIDDPRAWSKQTFRNLVSFVERDRQVLESGANREVNQRDIDTMDV